MHDHLQNGTPDLPEEPNQTGPLIFEPGISEVFYQDVSGSIKQNGVEIVSSSVFTPYFNDVNRNIELNFGIIDSLTAEKLVSLTLQRRNFVAPALPDLRKLSITAKRQEKGRFLIAQREYVADSIKFYNDRNQRIKEFCNTVDSKLARYKNGLSGQSDIITAVDIADKVFNYSQFGTANKYLLLNSDGFDSFHKMASKLKNNAEVILINAGKKSHTSFDSILTTNLQSSEQAIEFTLNNPKN
ncbi:MAG: hypothetical protein ABJC12_09720 [Saprospiraceae bacterium]